VAKPRDLAREHALDADRQPVAMPIGGFPMFGEEPHLQRRPVGGQQDVDPVGRPAGAAVRVGVDLAAGDPPDHRQLLSGLEAGDLRQLAGLEIAAREVLEEVSDGAQPELLDLGSLLAVTEHSGNG
jgi:hypothetical protein